MYGKVDPFRKNTCAGSTKCRQSTNSRPYFRILACLNEEFGYKSYFSVDLCTEHGYF